VQATDQACVDCKIIGGSALGLSRGSSRERSVRFPNENIRPPRSPFQAIPIVDEIQDSDTFAYITLQRAVQAPCTILPPTIVATTFP